MQMPARLGRIHLSPFQIIIIGFMGVILTGTLLLMLPFARKGGTLSFADALFTATSSVCVTGLVTKNTVTFWSLFGQGVIIGLIQTGGLGVATIGILAAMIRQKKIGLGSRLLMQTSISHDRVGGIVGMTIFLLKLVFMIEFLGMLILMIPFVRDFGLLRGTWFAFFHSISAFCNAGFDLMGRDQPYSSLTAYSGDIIVSLSIMFLIIFGGIGFVTWRDIATHRLDLRKYHLQSKIILLVTSILILVPTVFFFLTEYQDLPLGKRLLVSLFQAVTPRTAGFNTMPIDELSETGQLVMIILMLTGGAPGSTAGGMKVTTAFVLFALLLQVFSRSRQLHIFRRSIGDVVIKHAAAVFLMYLSLFLLGGILITNIERTSLLTGMFETASALGTVGLTVGITPTLKTSSKIILILYMFIGRVGGLTLIYSLLTKPENNRSGKLPVEDVAVG